MPPLSHFAWPFFAESHGNLPRHSPNGLAKRSANTSIMQTWINPAARWFVLWARRAGSGPWCRRPMAAYRKNSTCARFAPRARFSPGTTASPILPSPCRGWDRLDIAVRQRRDQGQISAAGARRPSYRRFRAVRTGSGIRRQRAGYDRDQGWSGACPHRRGQDLDLQRRHRRSLRRVRAHRRGAWRQGPVRLRRRCRYAGSRGRRPHRGHRAASAGDASLHRLPRAAGQSARRRRARGSRWRWRRSIFSAPRSPPRRSGWRAAPSTK